MESFNTPRQLVQQYLVTTFKLRLPALCCFFQLFSKGRKIVVFMSTCDSVTFHAKLFETLIWPGDFKDGSKFIVKEPVSYLHGNLPQSERYEVGAEMVCTKSCIRMD